jgi:Zn-dependent protease
MGLISLLLHEPVTFLLLTVPLLYSVIAHELAHGWVAYRLGDPTARSLGRLTLNPLKHLDLMGTLMLFLFGFGWAKPVPVNPDNLHGQRGSLILVSAAGIAANTILAFLALFCSRLLSSSSTGAPDVMLQYLAQINIMLASFNLIPIPPLDGSKILAGFLPVRYQSLLARVEPFGFFLIIGLLYLGALTPLTGFFRRTILAFINLFLHTYP